MPRLSNKLPMSKPARIDSIATDPLDTRQIDDVARVWDPFVRFFHWSLVASFAVAWLTSHSSEAIHHWAGYVAAMLIILRLIWGVAGTTYARFSQFVRHPKAVLSYLVAIVRGGEARYLGHNPAGGAMILILLAAMIATAVSGWMMTTDRFFGFEWVENLHSLLSHAMLVLVAIHLGGVMLASYRHRENLVGAMISGRKRAAAEDDIA
jgi:cytochrome b